MSFNLGNFSVKEIIMGVAEKDDSLVYVLDQLQDASIEVSAESTDITDKNGAVLRTIYQAKTASFTATSALLSPVILNAQSGSEISEATEAAALAMPYITVVVAGASIDVSNATEGTIGVIGLYNNGANGKVLEEGTSADYDAGTYALVTDEEEGTAVLTLPAAGTDLPSKYLVKYTRNTTSGIMLANYANVFASAVSMTLYAAIMDPCESEYRAAYIVLPNLTPDPSVTISFSPDEQTVDFSGTVGVDYCTSVNPVLYYIYFPDENAVTTVVSDETSISLDKTTASIEVDGTTTLTATTNPEGIAVTYTSSDSTIATVTSAGVVTGVAEGTVTITATAGSATATCVVTVSAATTYSITLDKETTTVAVDGTDTITATVSPEGTDVTWASDDETVATVADGVVTGVSAGTATITATAGTASATCEVTVE